MLFTVLGSSGFVGSHLTRHLRAQGHEVYAPSKGDAEIFKRDLGRVIYAIGLTADFRQRAYDTADAHVCYLTRVLRDAHYSSLTYLSSVRVYQGAESGCENAMLRTFPDVDGLYNLSKLTGEALCMQSGRGRVARLANIVGEGASESFVAQLISEVKTGHLHLRSSKDSAKDYLLIDDAINALAVLAEHDEAGIYNLASGSNISTGEILQALAARFEFSTTLEEACAKLIFPLIDTTRIAGLLDWQPKSVIQWLRETPSLRFD